MGKFYKILLLSCFFVVSSLSSYAQTIGFIRFNNSANYTPGSGVSVIINPTGVFELNNQFVLELSNPGGAFTSPIRRRWCQTGWHFRQGVYCGGNPR